MRMVWRLSQRNSVTADALHDVILVLINGCSFSIGLTLVLVREMSP